MNKLPAPAPDQAQLPFLRIYKKQEFVRSIRLQQGIFVAGRETSCDIVLDDVFVSRKHFQIDFQGEHQLYLQDLGSANGTLLNGHRVVRSALAHGDEIRIGETRLVIHHRASSRSNVIPFPEIKTSPRIEMAVPTPAVPIPRLVPKILRVFTLVLGAAGLAYLLNAIYPTIHSWMKPPIPIAQAPSVEVESRKIPRVERPTKKNFSTEKIKSKQKKQETKSKRRAVDVDSPDFVASVNRSLEGVSSNPDLRVTDRMRSSVKDHQGSAEIRKNIPLQKVLSMDVEVALPKMGNVAALRESERKRVVAFDPAQYQAMLRSRIEGIEVCYAKHVPSGAGGKITVWFKVAKSGRVAKAGIGSSSFKGQGLHQCILDRVNGLQLEPPPWDPYEVTYGFRFGGRKKITF